MTPYWPLCVVSVWQALLVWWQNVEATGICSTKSPKIHFLQPIFGCTDPKIQWLDPKANSADLSWLLVEEKIVLKMSLCLINDQVIWCLKSYVKNMTEEGRRGPARVWGSDKKDIIQKYYRLSWHSLGGCMHTALCYVWTRGPENWYPWYLRIPDK